MRAAPPFTSLPCTGGDIQPQPVEQLQEPRDLQGRKEREHRKAILYTQYLHPIDATFPFTVHNIYIYCTQYLHSLYTTFTVRSSIEETQQVRFESTN